jgi:hypothetical protein
MRLAENERSEVRSASRIIPRAKLSGIIYDTQPLALGFIHLNLILLFHAQFYQPDQQAP